MPRTARLDRIKRFALRARAPNRACGWPSKWRRRRWTACADQTLAYERSREEAVGEVFQLPGSNVVSHRTSTNLSVLSERTGTALGHREQEVKSLAVPLRDETLIQLLQGCFLEALVVLLFRNASTKTLNQGHGPRPMSHGRASIDMQGTAASGKAAPPVVVNGALWLAARVFESDGEPVA